MYVFFLVKNKAISILIVFVSFMIPRGVLYISISFPNIARSYIHEIESKKSSFLCSSNKESLRVNFETDAVTP